MADRTEFMQDGLGAHGDDFYQLLMEAHDSLSTEESAALNARVVLLMANQIGDLDVIREILNTSRSNK